MLLPVLEDSGIILQYLVTMGRPDTPHQIPLSFSAGVGYGYKELGLKAGIGREFQTVHFKRRMNFRFAST